MDQKYGEFVGVDSLYYAVVTDTDASYVAATPVYLAPTAEISGEPAINNTTVYYDNKAAGNYIVEGSTELKITVSNLPAHTMATILGKKYDSDNGLVLDSGEVNPPKVAIGFRYNMGTDGYRYYWYLAGTLSGGAEEATSKQDKIDVKTYILTYTAVTTTHKWTIDGNATSLKRIFGDTADESFDGSDWFTAVKTPVA